MLVLFATDDLGSGLLYYGIFLGMLYVATARAAFVAGFLGLFLVGAVGVYWGTPHVRERVHVWLNPWPHEHTSGYQILQSLYSIAHGGYGGTGLGKGTFYALGSGGSQAAPLIPYVNTDFIYSALAQELGLIGAAALLLVYMLFVLRGFRTAVYASDG